jgi:DNA polymerase III subunit alpha
MTERVKSVIPFVNLHGHSTFSVFDGLGYPDEHMDFAYENGMDALALTDHGSMNGLSYQVLHHQKMKEKGINFKPIFGVEAYFHHSIAEWKQIKESQAAAKKAAKSEDDEVSLTVENEEESKSTTKNVLNKRRHLVLLAQNQVGLNNIFTLISKSYQGDNYYRFPRIDYDMLKAHNEGVIASSACLGGIYAGDYWENYEGGPKSILEAMRDTTKKMMEIFGDRWYGELQWNDSKDQMALNGFIVKLSQEFGFKLISTADSHYPRPEMWKDRILYKKIGWLNKKDSDRSLPETVDEVGYELFPKNGDQMMASFEHYSQIHGIKFDRDVVLASITEAHNVAMNRIENFVPDNKVKLPTFVVPENTTADEELTRLSNIGLENLRIRSQKKREEYQARLDRELVVIKQNNFSQYFLTMKAIADRANQMMLSGPGRGSGAGALVSYILGITQIDPIKWELQFERFMRSNQKDYPDIDFDVADPMTLKDTLIKEWGMDKVAPITNWNTLQLKSLIKDISKFYDIEFSEVNDVTSKMMLEATPLAKQKNGIKAGLYVPTFEEVMEFSESLNKFLEQYPQIKQHVNALHGQIRSASRHAGGVVVAEKINESMPLINSGGVIQTPWSEGQNVRHLEPLGFIKFDVLGLATLKMIETAVSHILKRHKGIKNPTFDDIKKYYDETLHPDVLDLEDQKVYQNVFHNGKWAGIFQFTENGAQRFCQRAKPTNIIDLSAITSIYRPGPLNADVDKNYVEARESPTRIKYIHSLAREVTEDTFGFLIFQEQIASMAHKLGKDLSLEEGNQLRKVLTKKGTGKEDKVKTALYDKFITGCVEKNISKKAAEEQWKMFEFFSGYGFNKSHAVSYSIISYQCAWLLTYFAAEWMAAFLDKEPEDRKEKAVNIAKGLGFKIKQLDVNTSGEVWEIDQTGETLIQPLMAIKGFGESAFKEIVSYRPFKTVEEFLFNPYMSYSKLNKKALDVLCRSGALDSLVDNRFSGAKHFWSVVAVDRPRNLKKFEENLDLYRPEGDFTEEEKIVFLTELTGFFPLNRVMDLDTMNKLEDNGIKPIGDYDPELQFVWFIPRKKEVKKTKNGKEYWVLDVVDSSSKVSRIRCWGIQENDVIHINRPYMARIDFNEQFGFSTRSIRKSFRLLA